MSRLTAILLLALSAGPLVGAASEWAVAIFPSGDEFSLEIAADPASRARGYMYREKVERREGMLFIFESSERHSIWMLNCKVPLDVVWLDERQRVVEIAHELQPCDPDRACPSSLPLKPAKFVIELAGGTAAELGLRPGDRVEILADLVQP
jgi:uncharacterized membrane protein (UPF0127 family)